MLIVAIPPWKSLCTNKDCTKIYPTLLEIPILGTTFCSFLGFGIWRFDIELFSLVKFLVITNNLCVCLRIGISYIFSDPKKITLSLLDGPRLTVTCIPVVEGEYLVLEIKIFSLHGKSQKVVQGFSSYFSTKNASTFFF